MQSWADWIREGIERERARAANLKALRETEALGRQERALAAHEDPYIELGGEA